MLDRNLPSLCLQGISNRSPALSAIAVRKRPLAAALVICTADTVTGVELPQLLAANHQLGCGATLRAGTLRPGCLNLKKDEFRV